MAWRMTRSPIVPLLVERRQDNLPELLVKGLSILKHAVFGALALRHAVNGPAGDAFAMQPTQSTSRRVR